MNNLRNQEAKAPNEPERHEGAGSAARITASRTFVRSPRLCSLLSFVMEQYLSGHIHELTEQNIAAHVFGRVKDFDSSSDNIVRVSMRQLRAKIKEYYEDEGRSEDWIVEIPKGGYVPLLRPRVAPAEAEVVPPNRGWQRMQIAILSVLMALSGVLLVTTVLLWRENERLKSGTRNPVRVSSETSLVMEAVLNSDQKTIVVPADSGLSLMELLAGRNIELTQYIGEKRLPVPPFLNRLPGRRLWDELQTRNLTHASMFSLVQTMEKQNPQVDIGIQHPRTLSPRNFKNGNFLLLGMTNPWIALFEPKLNFCFGRGLPEELWCDQKPRAGRRRTGGVPAHPGPGRVCALVRKSCPGAEPFRQWTGSTNDRTRSLQDRGGLRVPITPRLGGSHQKSSGCFYSRSTTRFLS